jgi:hypothetical protein
MGILAACTLAACSPGPAPTCTSGPAPTFSPTPSTACGAYDALVAASDYMSSEIGTITLGGGKTFEGFVDLGTDPALESSAGRFFWIAQDSGYIIEVDPQCLSPKATYDANDCDHAGATDPQDIAVAPDGSLWIARLDVSSLLVLNPDGSRRRTIDLSGLDTRDGNPNANAIRILDPTSDGDASTRSTPDMATSRAFVSLDILDDNASLASTRPSKIAEIDLQTGAILHVLQLKGRNPFGLMVQDGNVLYLADAGSWTQPGEVGAGIERLDAASFTSELLVSAGALGGHAVQVAVTSSCGVAIVAGASPCNPTSLVAFDPASGALAAPALLTTTGYDLEGLAWTSGDRLLVGDRSSSLENAASCPSVRTAVPGGFPIHVFDRSGVCTLTEQARPIVIPQAPIAIASLH